MKRIASKLCLGAVFFAASMLAVASEVRLPIRIPVVLQLVAPDARLPIQLQKVDVKAEVLGSVAHTRVEMVFFNPNMRILEGELQFPLLDGQTVTGFALDINGELRPAVPVDKVRGQQVFEEVSRARIDPALLEKTQGNNYKLRVYPLPANGTRRVVLEYDEALTTNHSVSSYRLPLQFGEAIGQLDVAVHNAAIPARLSERAVSARLGAERIAVKYDHLDHGGSRLAFSRKNYVGRGMLSVDYPAADRALTAIETRADQTYFYAEVAAPHGKPALRTAPARLGIVWDASGSGASRDHGREFALLDAYFKALGRVTVELLIARDVAEAVQSFAVVQGDWHALRAVLEAVAYDGATAAAALSPSGSTDLNLLFSDGLSNYGAGILSAGNVPLYAVNAAASADLPRLRAVAENTGGRVLNLQRISPVEAVDELTHQHARLTGMHGAKELVSAYDGGGMLKMVGILTEPEATLTLDWVDAQGKKQSQQVVIRNAPVSTLAASRWAALQLAQLETDYANNRASIRRLGNRFGMVTRETSLIVLDRVEDYLRFEIEPPESLRAEYQARLAFKHQELKNDRRAHLDDIANRFAKKILWWETSFPKGDKPLPPHLKEELSGRLGRLAEADSSQQERANVASYARAPAPATPPPPSVSVSDGPSNASSPVQAIIQLKKWQSDAPYVRRLREAAPVQMYRVYLDERPAYTNSTSFFLDAADIFIERGQMELGLRILSNLAEMNLENRGILRILAYRLLQAKQTKLALPILQQVLALSPNEPQSLRDLGLAYAEDGQYQQAVDNLWEVVSKPWHGRFPDVELIALAELNAIIARAPNVHGNVATPDDESRHARFPHLNPLPQMPSLQSSPASGRGNEREKQSLIPAGEETNERLREFHDKGGAIDTGRMDARLLRNLPLEMRAVLSWDADNTDIDLWVTDPNNERVYYGNRLGYQGGAMSRDFTGGYGPEEFSLRDAKPGKYKVQAHFFGNRQQVVSGATTLMLRLSTGFGTAGQKDENIILRLTGQGAEVEVGTFEIK